jgi:hypothetical protein
MPAESVIFDSFRPARVSRPFGNFTTPFRAVVPTAPSEGVRPSLFQRPEWEKVLTDTYGYIPVPFAGSTGSRLPLLEVRSSLTGRRGISLPFTDHCEPLMVEENSFPELFQQAVEMGKSRGWKSLELRGGRKFLPDAPASVSFYGHTVDLAGDENQLFNRLESSVRRAIRKAQNGPVVVTVAADLAAVRIFYSLHCRTRRRHGLPPQPFSFFRNIHRHLISQNRGAVVLASYLGQPVAAAMHFCSGEEAIYKFGASDEAGQHLRANNLVMWEAMRWHRRNGARKLDLGRTSLANDGLRRFKIGWAAAERKIEYFKFDLRQNGFVASRDEVAGWHTRVFRTLPVWASRLAGAALYRHWA